MRLYELIQPVPTGAELRLILPIRLEAGLLGALPRVITQCLQLVVTRLGAGPLMLITNGVGFTAT